MRRSSNVASGSSAGGDSAVSSAANTAWPRNWPSSTSSPSGSVRRNFHSAANSIRITNVCMKTSITTRAANACNEKMLKINRDFLDHDYYTDVISFDYGTGKKVNGEIYIGIETIKENSVLYKVRLKEEVVRIMIHGTLHLMGYVDNEPEERNRMIAIQEKLVNEFIQ